MTLNWMEEGSVWLRIHVEVAEGALALQVPGLVPGQDRVPGVGAEHVPGMLQ